MEESAEQSRIIINSRINLSMKIILNQIFNYPFQGNLEKLYLEAKTLELTALFWVEYFSRLNRNTKQQNKIRLSDKDIECLHQVRNILTKKMDSPPTIRDLAQSIGINTTKLKLGFKRMYGSTIYVFVRKHRMEEAGKLLKRDNLTVSEVARKLGYNSLSHFTVAFKREFLCTPRATEKIQKKESFRGMKNNFYR